MSDMVVGLGPSAVTVPSSGMQFPHLDKVGAGLDLSALPRYGSDPCRFPAALRKLPRRGGRAGGGPRTGAHL